MRWQKTLIDGSFGDGRTVLTLGVVPRPRRVVMLFHGVHSCAQATPGNKYALLGSMLGERGVLPVLVETSRKFRNRHEWGTDLMGWIHESFEGKTFQEEMDDLTGALTAVQQLYSQLPLTLWGFSLGGLCALFLAGGFGQERLPDIDGLVMAGAGHELRPGRETAMKLPLLRDLVNPSKFEPWTRAARPKWLQGFYGSLDESFAEATCREVYNQVDCPNRQWNVIQGADHSFRRLNGQTSRLPLLHMVNLTALRFL